MARLKVSPELIAQSLFSGTDKMPTIVGASWDYQNEHIVLDIIGPGIPEGDVDVIATVTRRLAEVEFKTIEPHG